MQKSPRYSVHKYIIAIVIAASLGVIITAILLNLIGIPKQGIVLIIVGAFPIILYSCLRGFHKGLIDHYGFTEPESKK
jgi:hypothetical protein